MGVSQGDKAVMKFLGRVALDEQSSCEALIALDEILCSVCVFIE